MAVLLCRLVPGVHSLISIPAGIAGMNMVPFLIYTSVGTGVWTGFLVYCGNLLGSKFTTVSEYLDPVSWIVFAVLGAVYIVRVIRHEGA